MNIKGNHFLSNMSWMIGGKLFQMLVSLLVSMLTARYLGPANYGAINYAASLIAFFSSLCTLGLNGILIREFVTRPDREGTVIGTAVVMRLASSMLSVVAVSLIIVILDGDDPLLPMITVLQSLSLLFQVFDVLNYWYQSHLRSKRAAIIQSAAYTAAAAYKAVLLITQKSVTWFAFSATLDFALVAILLTAAYFRDGGPGWRFSLSEGKRMLSQSYSFILSGIMAAVFAQTDKLMIGKMMDNTAVGLYSAVIAISGLVAFIPSAVIDSARPIIMELKGRDEPLYARRVRQLYACIIWMSIGYGVLITLFSRLSLLILYGSAYLGAQDALRIAVWYCSFSYLGSAKNIWLICEGKQRYEMWFTLSGAITNILLNALLIPLVGIVGAAAATLITQIITNFLLPLLVPGTRASSLFMIQALLLRDVFRPEDTRRLRRFVTRLRYRHSAFYHKRLLLIGDNAQLTQALAERLEDSGIKDMRVLRIGLRPAPDMSRQGTPLVSLFTGSAHDQNALEKALQASDYVLYTPYAEGPPAKSSSLKMPFLLDACERAGIQKLVCLTANQSTDPLSDLLPCLSGQKKAPTHRPIRCSVRCPLPVGAPGAPLSVLVSRIRSRQTLILSHPDKTLYLTGWSDAADLALTAFRRCRDGDILLRQMPTCTLALLTQALREMLRTPVAVRYVGLSFGDKMYESLLSGREGRRVLICRDGRRTAPWKRKKGTVAFTSGNSPIMTSQQLQQWLKKQPALTFLNIAEESHRF